MKYSLNINQIKCQEWGLNLQQGAVLSLFTLMSTWADGKEINGNIYYYFSVNKIIEEIPMITQNKRSILRIVKFLKDKELINHIIIDNKGFYKMSELGKTYIGDSGIKIVSVTKKTYKYDKNGTLGMTKMAHNNSTNYNNTNNNISKDILETEVSENIKNISSNNPETFGNEEINKMQIFIKEKVTGLGFIYNPGKYERARIKNILTAKIFQESVEKSKLNTNDFVLGILQSSTFIDFWNGKINNAETIYKHYSKVLNDFIALKKGKTEKVEKDYSSEVF